MKLELTDRRFTKRVAGCRGVGSAASVRRIVGPSPPMSELDGLRGTSRSLGPLLRTAFNGANIRGRRGPLPSSLPWRRQATRPQVCSGAASAGRASSFAGTSPATVVL